MVSLTLGGASSFRREIVPLFSSLSKFDQYRHLEASSLGSLALSFNYRAPHRELFMALTAYVDDGGGHQFCVMAGFIGRVEQWVNFQPEWIELLREYNIGESHGKELKRFLGSLDAEKQAQYFIRAKQILDRHAMIGFAVGFRKTEYDLFYAPRSSGPTKFTKRLSQFGLSFQQILHICHLALLAAALGQIRFEVGEKINIIVDSGNPKSSEAVQLFEAIKRPATSEEATELTPLLGKLAFEADDTSPELQAADLLAWCFNFFLVNGPGLAPAAFFTGSDNPISHRFLHPNFLRDLRESEVAQSSSRAATSSKSHT